MSKFTLALTFSLLFFTIILSGQNTTEVQSFTYGSTTRDTVIQFPTGDHNQYEKILMVYSMRCKDGLVSPPVAGQTNIGCGEWDYSCNTYITDSSQVDSFYTVSPSHIISDFSGTVFDYTTQPTYTYYQSTQQEIIYNNIISENETSIGVGTDDSTIPFGGNQSIVRSQFLYPATELINLGLNTGDITGLKFDVVNGGAGFQHLRIKMKNSTKIELDPATIDEDGFTEVYYLNTDINSGSHFFKFHSPFNWDGGANILIDVSYVQSGSANVEVKSSLQANISSLTTNATDDQYLELTGSGYIEVDHPLTTVQDEITISFWNYGSDLLPLASTAFEGTDANNNRQINVHLPWGNGHIFWDCGNDGSGYDRISKLAAPDEFKNKWNHMAFTKNATTGEMKIYINGSLWHSGSGFNRSIDVQTFNIGSSDNAFRKHYGKIDDFQIWNKELSQTTIQEWMSQPLSSNHPNYANLVAHYSFDNASGTDVVDSSPNPLNGILQGTSAYRKYQAENLEKNITTSSHLPNLIFVQGIYDATINDIILLDSLVNIPNQVDEFTLTGTDLNLSSTNYFFEAGEMYIYDETGNIVDSVNVPLENSIAIQDLTHYTKRPAKYEIMSFVTPYGINLDLGMEGKSWIFDVTDFGPILKGNKRITMERGGQWQENNDIKFIFVEGTPSRNVISIDQVWPVTSENFTNIMNDVRYEPRNVILPTDADHVKLRAAITGHGQQGEFIPRLHFLNVEGGFNEFEWTVWKECAINPVHPQGGTWVYDRAGWCPGEATQVQNFNLTDWAYPGDQVELDYGVTAGSGDSRYIVNVQMVSYEAPNFELDAEVLDIINPSSKIVHGKYNPMCGKPKIVIRNNGTTPISSLLITYDVDGVSPKTFTWEGNMSYLQTREIELPAMDITALTTMDGTFNVTISDPNDGLDQYANNNTMSTDFQVVPTLGSSVVIRMKTNSQGSETSYKLLDINGNVLAFKSGALAPNTTYTDTLHNLNGCYRLQIQDTDDDGISWWANNDGIGFISIKELGAAWIILEPDFGRFLNYDFFAGDITPTHDLTNNKFLKIYPNPSSNIFFVELEGYQGELKMEVLNQMGQTLKSVYLEKNSEDLLQQTFDLSEFSSGIYYLKIQHEQVTEVKKLIKM